MMSTLTKRELAAQLKGSKPFSHLSQVLIIDLLESACDLIVCHLQEGGDKVTIRGFGVFKLRKRAAFTGTDPRNGKWIEVKAKTSMAFKPAAEVIRRLNT